MGIFSKPIVCVSVDGFYDEVERLLKRAEKDKLLHVKVEDCVKIVKTSKEAVEWIEAQVGKEGGGAGSRAKTRGGTGGNGIFREYGRTLGVLAVGFGLGVFFARRK